MPQRKIPPDSPRPPLRRVVVIPGRCGYHAGTGL